MLFGLCVHAASKNVFWVYIVLYVRIYKAGGSHRDTDHVSLQLVKILCPNIGVRMGGPKSSEIRTGDANIETDRRALLVDPQGQRPDFPLWRDQQSIPLFTREIGTVSKTLFKFTSHFLYIYGDFRGGEATADRIYPRLEKRLRLNTQSIGGLQNP